MYILNSKYTNPSCKYTFYQKYKILSTHSLKNILILKHIKLQRHILQKYEENKNHRMNYRYIDIEVQLQVLPLGGAVRMQQTHKVPVGW